MVYGDRSLGDDCWGAKDRIRHQRTDSNRLRLERHRGERGPAVEPRKRGGAGMAVMVGDEKGVEPELLDPSPSTDQRAELRIRNVENPESKLGHGSVLQ